MSDGYNPINAAMDHLGFGDPLKDVVSQGGLGFDPLKNVGMDMPPVGTDLFLDYGVKSWAQEMGPMTGATPGQQGTNWGATGAGVSTAGGNWAALDAHNAEIANSAAKYGVPANLIKSMINRESSGNWERDNYTYVHPDGTRMYPFVGMKEGAAQSVGFDFNSMAGNKQLQVDAMAAILARDYKAYGSWESAASNYLTGNPQAYLNPNATDVEGTIGASYYVTQAMEGWHYLDQLARTTGGGTNYLTPSGDWGSTGASPSSVVQAATSYVNVAPYVWGSVPGASQDPAVSGWDCSGMISWLNANYAPNSGLPNGSHYQYQWAQQTGQLFTDTAQLRPGDIVFFDTGNRRGGGGNLNAASHVAMYIGGGKMVHAANENVGTIISDLSAYQGMYGYLGAAHMPWSGGGSAGGQGGGGQPTQQTASYMSPGAVMAALMSGQKVPGYG